MDSNNSSRRDFIKLMTLAVGASSAYATAKQFGITPDSTYKGAIDLPKIKNKKRVLIIGAGVAGMSAAYELEKLGFECTIVEARERVGGRVWTIRGGDTFTEIGGYKQTCKFAKDEYMDPGPWRFPYHHRALLGYCKEFGIPLHVYPVLNYGAYFHKTKSGSKYSNQNIRVRELKADFQGHSAALLSKKIKDGSLNKEMPKERREQLLEALRYMGRLNKQNEYKESESRGFIKPPGAGENRGIPSEPMSLNELLDYGMFGLLSFFDDWDFQTTMMQPTGGIDRIAKAFESKVKSNIFYNCEVTELKQENGRVSLTYKDKKKNRDETISGDFCICTAPLIAAAKIESNLSSDVQSAIGAIPSAAATKTALQFKRRFWEEDDDIYGGVTWTDMPISQIAYPSHNIGHKKGVIYGDYISYTNNAFEFEGFNPEERTKEVLKQGSKIHPQYTKEFDNAFSIAWHRVPYSYGCYAAWSNEARDTYYKTLLKGDGNVFFAGEHMSYLPAWIEGAILSAHEVVNEIHARAK